MSEDKKIFEEAANDSLSKKIEEYDSKDLDSKKEDVATVDQSELALQLTEAGVDKWSVFSKRMTDDYAVRFMKEIDSLPGREFIKVYMKMLEYVKPKVVRVTQEDEKEEDKTIEVVIYNSVIDIEHEQE